MTKEEQIDTLDKLKDMKYDEILSLDDKITIEIAKIKYLQELIAIKCGIKLDDRPFLKFGLNAFTDEEIFNAIRSYHEDMQYYNEMRTHIFEEKQRRFNRAVNVIDLL